LIAAPELVSISENLYLSSCELVTAVLMPKLQKTAFIRIESSSQLAILDFKSLVKCGGIHIEKVPSLVVLPFPSLVQIGSSRFHCCEC
jgi:hypothetical protein